MTLLEILNIINLVLGVLFVFCYAFQFIYLVIPFVIRMPKHKEPKLHRLAILIPARDEACVIGTLIDSIKAQDYPAELISTVVIADNCSDNTADVAREHGALVYERNDTDKRGKGYALDFALHRLADEFGDDAFDAFIVFDADNILTANYVTEINKSFSDGYEVVTSYRNAKNYNDGWLAAASGLWYIRESKFLNGSRFRIGACPQVSGTGFLFSNEIKKKNGGWPFHTLTEDYEFTCDCAVQGMKFGYCETARFYDEQLPGFGQSWKQRMRWAKGGLQTFAIYWKRLVAGIFSKKFFACYDMTMSIAPAYIISILACFVNIMGITALIATGTGVLEAIMPAIGMIFSAYALVFIQGAVCTFTEWRRIRAPWYKKILYMFTFPFFLFTFIPIAFIAIFKKVEWEVSPHKDVAPSDAALLSAADNDGVDYSDNTEK